MSNVTAKSAHTVPMRDGSHQVVDRGQVYDLDDTSETYQESIKSDYGKNLVEKGGKAEKVAPEGLLVDPGEVTKERVANLTPEERNGVSGDPVTAVPPRMDDGRTLPESGVDQEADARFADGSADTSESGRDMGVQRADEAEGLPKPGGRRGGRKAKETSDPKDGDPSETTADTGE